MRCVHIHIEGVVQGVGFRPTVYNLATQLNLKGWVCNGMDGVHIEVGGEPDLIRIFLELLQKNPPSSAYVTRFTYRDIDSTLTKDFSILESNSLGQPHMMITPDLGLCDRCRHDIADPTNKRFNYPFTTCTDCGPRYSIIESLPYDRHNTTMKSFQMCQSCDEEYFNPMDRRYYAQTNSCPDCAIDIELVDNKGEIISKAWSLALPEIIRILEQGKTIAVKGIGGYLLIADATDEKAVRKLRERKQRPAKPFALMYPGLETLEQDALLSQTQREAFDSMQSPIVLVKVRKKPASGICVDEIAPSSQHIGVMKPYTAMFELLLSAWKKPIIATSGNVSGSPIVYNNADALESLSDVADYFLMHNRDIRIAEDDSVMRFTANDDRIFLRRSRGFAPAVFNCGFHASDECILAMGADMKSTFALQHAGQVYVSQYLGDLETYESQVAYRRALDHLLNVLKAKPELVIVDAHPNYFSSQLGRELAEKWNIPVRKIFHHHAHAWSVLSDNNLLNAGLPVLCVVWDGTGFGTDKQIWGGEFFAYKNYSLERIAHLNYVDAWLGDAMAREPRLSALFHCKEFIQDTNLRNKFNRIEWNYYRQLVNTDANVQTSSAGRLFDAVASLLGLIDFNTFEGEAAMLLETVAHKGSESIPYQITWENEKLLTSTLFRQILDDLNAGVSVETIAYKFHEYLANVIAHVSFNREISHVALSGGVFQNALLVELIQSKIGKSHVYIHRELSPNDENISYGQLVWAAQQKNDAPLIKTDFKQKN